MAQIWRLRGDGGAMVVEFVIIIPALFLVLALIYAFGQKVQADGLLDSGARDGARAASQARNFDDARTLALAAVTSVIGTSSPGCVRTLSVDVDGGDPAAFVPGGIVTVVASCTYTDYLGISMRPRATFSSPLDVNRGICPDGQATC
jgi:Flp pilus assembly protein TadG